MDLVPLIPFRFIRVKLDTASYVTSVLFPRSRIKVDATFMGYSRPQIEFLDENFGGSSMEATIS